VQSLMGEQCENALHDTSLPFGCEACQFASFTCGDGVIDAGEECDDGNHMHNDDCDSACKEVVKVLGVSIEVEPKKPALVINQPAAPQVAPPIPSNPVQTFFPTMPTRQPLPYQLPLAQLQPLIQAQGPVGDTGPAAVAVVASGMAAGLGWMRRKRK
jgi:cysteine-rich repeat protein